MAGCCDMMRLLLRLAGAVTGDFAVTAASPAAKGVAAYGRLGFMAVVAFVCMVGDWLGGAVSRAIYMMSHRY